ncbi:MAG: hypothetical protein WA183_12390 [Chthoniobacterales bacterium]
MAPFFLSLRRAGFRGDIVVFSSSIDKESVSQLKRWGARVVPFRFFGRHVSNPAARPWWIWKRVFASGISESAKERVAHVVFHLFYRRHLLYLDFLRAYGDRYTRFFMTDCRDVFFQADPFAWSQSPGLHVFLEDESNKIGQCSHHIRWIASQFGEETLRSLRDETVCCAGTVFGDRSGLHDYLRQMVSLTMQANTLREADGDQGLHNFLVRKVSFPRITIHRNAEGPVMTVGVMRMTDLRLSPDDSVMNEANEVAPVVHQYDRIPELREMLLARIRHID